LTTFTKKDSLDNMKLNEYMKKHPKLTTAALAAKAKISRVTVSNVCHGLCLTNYHKAKALSEATGGVVTLDDLCGTRK